MKLDKQYLPHLQHAGNHGKAPPRTRHLRGNFAALGSSRPNYQPLPVGPHELLGLWEIRSEDRLEEVALVEEQSKGGLHQPPQLEVQGLE